MFSVANKRTSAASRLHESNVAAMRFGDLAEKKIKMKADYYKKKLEMKSMFNEKKLKLMEDNNAILHNIHNLLSSYVSSNQSPF